MVTAALLTRVHAAYAHQVVVPPKVLQSEAAQWPEHPSAGDLIVPVVVTVDEQGQVTDAEVEVSVGEAVDRAALQAARRWQFSPATVDGKPRAAKVRVAIRFVDERAEARAPEVPSRKASAETETSDNPEPIEVVVVGDYPFKSPVAVEIERDLLSAAPSRSGSDLLRRLPGVFVTQHSGEGKAHQIFFRGFDAVHGQDLEISVAGVPVNEVSNVHGQGYADLHFVIPEVVSTLQAKPGALRPEQGDFAVAGSVSYELGYDEPGVTASTALGEFDTRRLFLAYHPEDAPPGTFGAVELYTTDGFGIARTAQRASAILQLEHPFADAWQLRALLTSYAGRFESPGVLRKSDIDAGLVSRFGTYDSDQGGSSTRHQISAELALATRPWQVSLLPFYFTRNLRLRFNFTGALETGIDDNSLQTNDSTTFGFRAKTRRDLPIVSAKDALELGLYARHDQIRQQHLRSPVAEPLTDASIDATDVAAHIELELNPWTPVTWRGGVRIDALSYTVDDHLATVTRSAQGVHVGPKTSLDIALTPSLHVLGGYGAGFRSPQARSLGDGEATPFTKVHSFDAALSYEERQRFHVSLGAFGSVLSDDLVFNETTSRNEPAPATQRIGASLLLKARIRPELVSACSLSFTRATFRDSNERYQRGEVVPFIPRFVGRCDMAYERPLTQLGQRDLHYRVGLGLNMLASRPLPYGELGSNVFLADALAALRYGPVELSFEATNLLNAAWYDGEFVYASDFDGVPPSAIPQRHVSVGEPRRWLSTLTLRL